MLVDSVLTRARRHQMPNLTCLPHEVGHKATSETSVKSACPRSTGVSTACALPLLHTSVLLLTTRMCDQSWNAEHLQRGYLPNQLSKSEFTRCKLEHDQHSSHGRLHWPRNPRFVARRSDGNVRMVWPRAYWPRLLEPKHVGIYPLHVPGRLSRTVALFGIRNFMLAVFLPLKTAILIVIRVGAEISEPIHYALVWCTLSN